MPCTHATSARNADDPDDVDDRDYRQKDASGPKIVPHNSIVPDGLEEIQADCSVGNVLPFGPNKVGPS